MWKIHKINDHRSPPGLERKIARVLPAIWLGGVVVPLLVSLFARLVPQERPQDEWLKHIRLIDYLALGTWFTVWTFALVLTIGCIIVIVAKGPGYAADEYWMEEPEDDDRPR